MRGFVLSLLILALSTAATGQDQKEKLKEHPTLKIVSFSWSATAGYSLPGWSDGSSNGGIFPNVSNWGVSTGGLGGGVPRARRMPFSCRAEVTLKNSGSKSIRAVYLDYVFADQATGEELLRYQFRASKRIPPGATKTLRQDIYQKFGKHRKAFIPLEPLADVVLRTDEARQNLIIRRIEYSDGTVQRH